MMASFSKACVALAIAVSLAVCSAAQKTPASLYAKNESGINYVSVGSGEAVVLIHGFSASHEQWFETPLVDELKDSYTVIAVDLLGHGHSSKPHEPAEYGRNIQARIVQLLNLLEIDKAHFVGYSMGANAVGDLIVSNPDRVQSATMASGFFTTWIESEEEFAQFTEERGRSGERYLWEPENQDFLALAAVVRGAKYAVVTDEQIAQIETPTLLVFGSDEPNLMHDRRIESLPTSFKKVILEGADHDSEHAAILTEEFATVVRKFVDANSIR